MTDFDMKAASDRHSVPPPGGRVRGRRLYASSVPPQCEMARVDQSRDQCNAAIRFPQSGKLASLDVALARGQCLGPPIRCIEHVAGDEQACGTTMPAPREAAPGIAL